MQYVTLPNSSLTISQICLGAMMFGGKTDEAESFSIMDYAFSHGLNFIDTANIYNDGESERIVGKWLKHHRQDIILATKVGAKLSDHPNRGGLSRYSIMKEVDESLKRLDTDYIDIYYLHHTDPKTSLEETLGAMNDLIISGKIRYMAVSNHPAWQIADMLSICEKKGYYSPVITQNVYNLLTRGIETELIPFLEKHKIGLSIYNPIAGGLLTGKYNKSGPEENTRFHNNQMYLDRYWSDLNFKAVEALSEIAGSHNLTLLQLAMKWCISNSTVTSIVSGVRTLEQIKQNMAVLDDHVLDSSVLKACDEVWESLTGSRFSYCR